MQFIMAEKYDTQDKKQAESWYRRAAEQGHAEALYRLATMLYNGNGIVQDKKQAALWYKKAANQEHVKSQNELALMLYNGDGIGKNKPQAITWLKRAAEHGYAYAQFNLSLFYDKGEGDPQDRKQAQYWLYKAVEQGLEIAQKHQLNHPGYCKKCGSLNVIESNQRHCSKKTCERSKLNKIKAGKNVVKNLERTRRDIERNSIKCTCYRKSLLGFKSELMNRYGHKPSKVYYFSCDFCGRGISWSEQQGRRVNFRSGWVK